MAAATMLALLGLAGCGGNQLKTYAVKGKVVLADGDVKQLADCYVEFVLDSDPLVRATGKIAPDGSFVVQTLHQGKVLTGAPAGTYRARIILSSEGGDEDSQFRKAGIDLRFLEPKASGLTIKVPPDEDITLKLTRAKPGAKLPREVVKPSRTGC